MIERFRQFLASPVFEENEEKTNNAMVITVLAGLLLGRSAAIKVALVSMATTLGIVVIESIGYPMLRFFPLPALSGWMMLVVSLVMTVIPLNLVLLFRSKPTTAFELAR